MTKKKYCYDYPRPAVTADIVALAGENRENLKILLIKRGRPPFNGMWALPGGFVDLDEELEETAARELEEETGLNKVSFKQIGAYGKVGRDPRHRTITIAYLAILNQEAKIKGGDDATEAKWFPVEGLPALAFDHDKIIEDGLRLWDF